MAGPFDRWPTGMGFDYFYGFIGGETHQYYPVLFENTTPVEPKTTPGAGLSLHDGHDRPGHRLHEVLQVGRTAEAVLHVFRPGAAHAPHHAPKEWRDKFKGQFDAGWEKVREETYERQLKMGIIPPGTKLTAEAGMGRAVGHAFCRSEEALCAADGELCRLPRLHRSRGRARFSTPINQLPDADNTMIIYIVGDNGASSEGGMTERSTKSKA